MHLQQKALTEKCSVNNGVLQKSVKHVLYSCDKKTFKNTCQELLFYTICRKVVRSISRTPTTYKGASIKNFRRA